LGGIQAVCHEHCQDVMLETRVTDVHDTAPQIVDQLLVALLRPPRTLLDSCRRLT
jgi:hypothetical protein